MVQASTKKGWVDAGEGPLMRAREPLADLLRAAEHWRRKAKLPPKEVRILSASCHYTVVEYGNAILNALGGADP